MSPRFLEIVAAIAIFVGCAYADLKDLDIEVIAPSSGVPKDIQDKVSKLVGQKLDLPSGTSSDQVFADEGAKFRKLDRALRSKHKILWALRGGYGLDKIMGRIASIDYSKLPKKIIIGYSDLTPLMLYLSQKYGWTAIHAPMLRDFATADKSKESYSSITDYLTGKTKSFTMSDLTPLNDSAKNCTITGKVTGGNLTCIISTIGTKWQIEICKKILFIEDVSINGYHLDRHLTHLKNAGLLSDVVAIVFGDFGADVTKILKRFASKLRVPVFKSAGFGHGKINLPFGYGFKGVIKSDTKAAQVKMSHD